MSDSRIITGDCLEIMPTLEAESVDSIVTDPPYGLSFMGKNWDHGIPGIPFWIEALRVAKPGAFLLAFGGTRTFHRLMCAIEDAGWEIRDTIGWLYGSGFPKSLNIGKAVDKLQGNEREDCGKLTSARETLGSINICKKNGSGRLTKGSSEWEGWGSALKPAWEPIVVARKPLSEKTVAENVLKYGTGGINIDGCRISNIGYTGGGKNKGIAFGITGDGTIKHERCDGSLGRFPANLIHDGSDEVLALFPHSKSGAMLKPYAYTNNGFSLGAPAGETRQIHESSEGSAARFFYCAKSSKQDRDEGCEGIEAIHRVNGNKWTDQDYRVSSGERPPSAESGPRRNIHPTVKPTALMRYLCRLVTPPNGIVLDPFAGSGSTGKAAISEGFRFIGIEKEPEYVEIIKKRIEAVNKQFKMF